MQEVCDPRFCTEITIEPYAIYLKSKDQADIVKFTADQIAHICGYHMLANANMFYKYCMSTDNPIGTVINNKAQIIAYIDNIIVM